MKNVLRRLNKIRSRIEREIHNRNMILDSFITLEARPDYKDRTLKLKGVLDSLGFTINFLTNYMED